MPDKKYQQLLQLESKIWQRAYSHYSEMAGTVDDIHRDCVRLAICTITALHEFGFCDAMIQAGSAGWIANPLAEVAFEWQEHDDDLLNSCAEMGFLPEVHCWAVLAQTEIVIDFAAPMAAIVAAEMGVYWSADTPRAIHRWTVVHGTRYEPSERATEFAKMVANNYLITNNLEEIYTL